MDELHARANRLRVERGEILQRLDRGEYANYTEAKLLEALALDLRARIRRLEGDVDYPF